MRNLTKSIIAASLLMPVSAYPLGIGEIKLHSALNQKLDAEIALLVSAGESVSDIKVRLAAPEKFDEAGVPWSYFLSKIKFKAVTLANGTTIVKLSSHEALREPFLDFLLEVTWPTGSLYREFTVLVDPPATYTQPIVPIIQKPQQAVVNGYVGKPDKKLNRRRNRQVQAVDGQYGPIGRNDYLWKVAKKTNVHDDVSVEQMMMALYEANPGAFYKPNVNALMAGKTLKIPERNAILKLSKKQALAAYKRQDNVWRGKAVAKSQQAIADESEIAAQLELEAPATDEIAETAISANEDDLSANRAVDADAKSSIATTGTEGMTLQARMEKLEQQLVMMQKMLALKDEQIAVLQNGKAGAADVANPVAESDKEKVKKAETLAQPKKPDPVAVKPAAKPAVVKKAPKKPKPVVQPEPEAEVDLWTLILGGSGAAILGVLGWMWWRKRQDEDDLDNESVFASATEISLPDSPEEELSIPVEDDFSEYDVGTVGESSFLSAFTPSDFDAFDADETEVDPISEADVYLAYGRYQQAEDLMRQAIQDYPDRDECKLKLLEIFYTNENKSSFEEYAEELTADGKHEDKGFWAKVAEMGNELSPGSSLYAMDNATIETIDLEQPKSKNESDQILDDSQDAVEDLSVEDSSEEDFDLSVFDDNDTVQSAVKVEDKKGADENDLDFDLSVFDLDGAGDDKKSETENVVAEDVEAIDFDLDSMALDDSEQKEVKVDEASEIESVDFDLGTGLEADEKNAESDEVTAESESDIDLESFELSLNDDKDEKITAGSENAEDFDFDFDTPVSSTEPVTELDTGVSDLTDMDELETKMDLARAYIDMGDTGAAKDIVEEVLEKGNDQQKQSAQEILDQLK